METLILAVLRQYSRQLLCFTLFAKYFLLNPLFLTKESRVFGYGEWYLAAILSLLPFSRNFVEFMLKSGVFGRVNLYVLPSV
jgi:hypothetical protein